MIAGIDFSTKAVDIVLLHDEKPDAVWRRYRLDYAPGDAFQAARRVPHVMPNRGWWTDTAIMAGIERPYSKSFRASSALLRIQGAIVAGIPLGLDLLELPPQTWKRELTGRANADKAAVRIAVGTLWPMASEWPYDACDAYGIAYALRAICERQAAA